MYEETLELIRDIRQTNTTIDFQIEHIYKEFNADADSTANETIDAYQMQIHASGIVIFKDWRVDSFRAQLARNGLQD